MLRISRRTRYCPAIEREVEVDCQYVEVNGKVVGPERVVSCDSKQVCKIVYEDEVLMIKVNWQKCALNR